MSESTATMGPMSPREELLWARDLLMGQGIPEGEAGIRACLLTVCDAINVLGAAIEAQRVNDPQAMLSVRRARQTVLEASLLAQSLTPRRA